MKIISSLESLQSRKKVVLTVGNFDGVHRGHLKILRQIKRDAVSMSALSGVITFKKHPRKTMPHYRAFMELNQFEHKVYNIYCVGVDFCWVVNFDAALRQLAPEMFLRTFFDPKKVAKIVVGYDFAFGKGRQGTVEHLKQYCRTHHIRFQQISAVTRGTQKVSSNRIRTLVARGDMHEAKRCLGRAYSIMGKVVKGIALGRKLDAPTANVLIPDGVLMPADGVYRVQVRDLGKDCGIHTGDFQCAKKNGVWSGLAYKGPRPDPEQKRSQENIVEVFIFNFSGNLYGHYLVIECIDYVRRPQKTVDFDELKALIHRDIERGKDINKKRNKNIQEIQKHEMKGEKK